AMDELNARGMLKFDIAGVDVELSKDDLLIEMIQKEGYMTEADNTVTVVLDTNLTEELVEEGFVYEIISKIQTMRKEAGYEVMDHIQVLIGKNDKIASIVRKNEGIIAGKVLADKMSAGEADGTSGDWYVKEWNVNGEKVDIGICR
ncbi:MAG: isoleucine--tRNA ligase, partial [Kineothrix sp.]|nr:isoleucine--tRNA ligase [Kineothrix sp.]